MYSFIIVIAYNFCKAVSVIGSTLDPMQLTDNTLRKCKADNISYNQKYTAVYIGINIHWNWVNGVREHVEL